MLLSQKTSKDCCRFCKLFGGILSTPNHVEWKTSHCVFFPSWTCQLSCDQRVRLLLKDVIFIKMTLWFVLPWFFRERLPSRGKDHGTATGTRQGHSPSVPSRYPGDWPRHTRPQAHPPPAHSARERSGAVDQRGQGSGFRIRRQLHSTGDGGGQAEICSHWRRC